ncbi:MAG: DUF2878 domain-containing protein [Pseudomonadales bacterium]
MAISDLWRKVFNGILFQLGWFVCVLGGNGWGLLLVAAIVFVHLRWISIDSSEWRLLALVAAMGFAVDYLSIQLGWVVLPDSEFPFWLVALWFLFATTLRHCLSWLSGKVILSSVIGALGGSGSYLLACRLGAAEMGGTGSIVVVYWCVTWSIMLPIYLWLAKWEALRSPAYA